MAYVSIFMFPDNRRLIQFRCNQLIHRTGTKYLVILAVKSLGKRKSEKLPRKVRFRRLIPDIISEIDDHSHFLMFKLVFTCTFLSDFLPVLSHVIYHFVQMNGNNSVTCSLEKYFGNRSCTLRTLNFSLKI